jgi:protoporphyrinogen oxidase
MKKKIVVIIGAGPAGLTCAYELLKANRNVKPIVIEKAAQVGGLSKTVNHQGNRLDIGGHRLFTKSGRIMKWWQEMLPLEKREKGYANQVSYQQRSARVHYYRKGVFESQTDNVILIRKRVSRILFNKRLFDYPLSLSWKTLKLLGLWQTTKIVFSYLKAHFKPIKPELHLEDFYINRFGSELYKTFFKDYTQKVWGLHPRKIGADWGKQRIKGLSVTRVLVDAWRRTFFRGSHHANEVSLIEYFLYPKLGIGSLWEEVARRVIEMGGEIRLNESVEQLIGEENRIDELTVLQTQSKKRYNLRGDVYVSSMPISHLTKALSPKPSEEIFRLGSQLAYRDFLIVGVLLKKMVLEERYPGMQDNWIYVQEPGIAMGRIQFFHNWSPKMCAVNGYKWLGLEYFCNHQNDSLWKLADQKVIDLALSEAESIGLLVKEDVLDAVVVRETEAYPVYTGTYLHINRLQTFFNSIENLYLIGRNGMHRYNNQDHSMLTAIEAATLILNNSQDRDKLWKVNADSAYQEKH